MRTLLLAVLASLASSCAQAWAADKLIPGPDGGCINPGDDGGTHAEIAVPGNSQFMVSASSTVNYRACRAGSTCVAAKNDAPIAGGAQVDTCMPPLYSTVSFFIGDGGTATVCVYSVNPKTVCQINSP